MDAQMASAITLSRGKLAAALTIAKEGDWMSDDDEAARRRRTASRLSVCAKMASGLKSSPSWVPMMATICRATAALVHRPSGTAGWKMVSSAFSDCSRCSTESGGAGEGGVVETAELVRGTQGAQATMTGSSGDGMPVMEGNSESDNEPGEQPRGVGSFYSLGSSLGRTGGAGDTARVQRGVNPKIGRYPGAGPQHS